MAAKSLISGGSSGILRLERRQFYIEPNAVAELYPSVFPFTTSVINAGVRNHPDDPLFKMFEHRSAFVRQYMQINMVSGATIPASGSAVSSIVVDGIKNLASTPDASYKGLELEVWDSSRTTKKGVVIVTNVDGSGNLTLKHLYSPAGADITIADNDYLIVVGNARGEGTTAPEAWSDELEIVWNQTQFFSVPVEVTGKLYKASLRGYSNELARLRAEKAKEFKMQQEQALLKGGSPLGTNMDGGDTFSDGLRTDADGNPLRTTMGLITAIEEYGYATGDNQNKFTINSSSYTYADFVDDMEKVFQYDEGQGTKFAFCGPGALSYWSKMDGTNFFAGKSGWTVNLSDFKSSQLGFNVRILETPHGLLYLVPTKALKYEYNKTMVIPTMQNLEYVVYEPNEFRNDVKKDNDYDGIKDVYRGDIGLGIKLIESHNLINIV